MAARVYLFPEKRVYLARIYLAPKARGLQIVRP